MSVEGEHVRWLIKQKKQSFMAKFTMMVILGQIKCWRMCTLAYLLRHSYCSHCSKWATCHPKLLLHSVAESPDVLIICIA